jgi:hypothetical protein
MGDANGLVFGIKIEKKASDTFGLNSNSEMAVGSMMGCIWKNIGL